MIDAKIIVEAAIQNADKYNPCRSTLDREEACRASFKDGIEWYKEAIWHDASEKPEYRKPIIIKRISNTIGGTYVVDVYCNVIPWKSYANVYDIIKWCYIEDILPKGGKK